jgi:hypothetical protein
MALEDKIDTLITAVNKLADVMAKNGGGAAAGAKAGGATAGKAGGDKAAAISADDLKALIVKVKNEKGEDAAKEVIKGALGKNGKLADLLALSAKFPKAKQLAEAALAAEDDEPEPEVEDDDEL